MKLDEVMQMAGVTSMMSAGANPQPQVVQPFTVYSDVPEQTVFNTPAVKKILMKQIDLAKFNKKSVKVLKNYFDGKAKWEEIDQDIKEKIFKLYYGKSNKSNK